MLPRGKRLPPGAAKLQNPQTMNTPFFRVRIVGNGEKHNRFLITVPISVDRRAVVRNRVRRAVREHVRTWKEGGMDIVYIALPPAGKAEQKELSAALDGVYTAIRQLHSQKPQH